MPPEPAASVLAGPPADVPPAAAALRDLALRAGQTAAPALLARFGRPAEGLEAKSGPTDLVSRADREAEATIVRVLAAARPEDGLRGEEGAAREGSSGLTWLIDPLDGTTNFLWGLPHWAVSVGVADGEGLVAGAVLDPVRGETWSAGRGVGARGGDGLLLRGPVVRPLAEATLGGDLASRADGGRRAGVLAAVLAPRVGHLRSFGSVALDLAWLAAGRLDAVVHERAPRDWDVAAGLLLCREAGLRAELEDGRLLAAAPALFPALSELCG